ncbi:MAG: hypothetical protein MZV70_64215 [Desulfobacterales bacterium]|nr:hypothetical protein [Desulfobacterales bacterium]
MAGKPIDRMDDRARSGQPLSGSSGRIHRIVCEIAEIAKEFGAEVPFMRPVELAADETTDLPVYRHALSWLGEQEGCSPDLVVWLRPTSPLRGAKRHFNGCIPAGSI